MKIQIYQYFLRDNMNRLKDYEKVIYDSNIIILLLKQRKQKLSNLLIKHIF